LSFTFNPRIIKPDTYISWERLFSLPISTQPYQWSLTKNKKATLKNQVFPFPKITQVPCSLTHKSEIIVNTINFYQNQEFKISKTFLKTLTKKVNWKWILEEEDNSLGWPHLPSTTLIPLLKEARRREIVILTKDLKPYAQ